MKLRECNVFSRVCLSTGRGPMWPLPMMHWTLPYRDLPVQDATPSAGPQPPWACSNFHSLDLIVQDATPCTGPPTHAQTCLTWTSLYNPPPRTCLETCSLWSTYERLTFYWNNFLFLHSGQTGSGKTFTMLGKTTLPGATIYKQCRFVSYLAHMISGVLCIQL